MFIFEVENIFDLKLNGGQVCEDGKPPFLFERLVVLLFLIIFATVLNQKYCITYIRML